MQISIKQYKNIDADQYERAARLQRANDRIKRAGITTNFKYNLDALVIIDGNLYLMDESERANA